MGGPRSRIRISKTEAVSRQGMVASKHREASSVGVAMLKSGGNAVDAAVATALAVGVVEPWSSGIGGGGYAVVAHAGAVQVIAFPMQAAGLATPERYPLDGRGRVGGFLWDGVVGDRNYHGYDSMAVPGAVAGLSLLLAEHGSMPWKEVVQPAVDLARNGYDITWHDSFVMGQNAAAAQRSGELGRIFYPDGVLPPSEHFAAPRLRQPDLAETLEVLAREGPDAFYRGDIAKTVIEDSRANGGLLRLEDLGGYHARIAKPITAVYRGRTVCVPGPGCAGPTTVETLNIFRHVDPARLGHASNERLHAFMWASRLAQADRFAFMSDPQRAPAPWSGLISPEYAAHRYKDIDPARAPTDLAPGDAWVYAHEDRKLEREKIESSTTHLCTADSNGTFVSLTNTLGGSWGSEVVPRGTGIVWNDGMYWFDPVPGRPNSVAPHTFGLNNMSPAIVLDGGQPVLAVGASGGRRITNCVCQLVSHIFDHDMGIQAAIEAPRVDASTPWVTVDGRFGESVLSALRSRGWDARVPPTPGNSALASPTGILVGEDGVLHGGVDTFHSAEAHGC